MNIKKYIIASSFIAFSFFGSFQLASASCGIQSLKDCDRAGLISVITNLIKSKQNNEALLLAANKSDLKNVKRLIASGADVNYRRSYELWDRAACLRSYSISDDYPRANYYHHSALDYATENGDYEIIKYLVANGAKNNSLLFEEIMSSTQATNKVKEIFKINGDIEGAIDYVDNYSSGALVSKGDLVKLYRDNGNISINMIKKSIKAGADINAFSYSSSLGVNNILTLAIHDNNIELIDTLVDLGADVNTILLQPTDDCITYEVVPIEKSCNPDVIKKLLSLGANPGIKLNGWNGDILLSRILCEDISIVKELTDAGADINAIDSIRKETVLTRAINNESKILNELVALGADVNFRYAKGYTLLMEASKTGNIIVAEGLMNLGANTNATDNDNGTALMEAAYYNNLEIAQSLVFMGADVKMKDKRGKTALDYAKEKNNIKIIEFLKDTEAK